MKLRVFLFEDNPMVLEFLTYVLQDRGYEVHAFPEIHNSPFFLKDRCSCPEGSLCGDVIVTDLKMPCISGLQFVEHQRKQGCRIRNIAVVSGHWSPSNVRLAGRLGCTMFQKPFSMDEFYRWLDHCEQTTNPDRRLCDWFERRQKVET